MYAIYPPVLRDHQKRRVHEQIGLSRLKTHEIGDYWRRDHCVFGIEGQWVAVRLQLIIFYLWYSLEEASAEPAARVTTRREVWSLTMLNL